jgi:hypothetical protein
VNPAMGVVKMQVTMPDEEDLTLCIEVELELLIALIVTGLNGIPLGSTSIFTSPIEYPVRFAFKNHESINSPVSESTNIKSGAEV